MPNDKRKRKYRRQNFLNNKRPRVEYEGNLAPGQSGFLITCNKYEAEALREAYYLLDCYVSDLGDTKPSEDVEPSDSEELDVAESLKKECQELKSTASKKDRLFMQVKSPVKNCLFIKMNTKSSVLQNLDPKLVEPSVVACQILQQCQESKSSNCRHINRFLPIETTCKADLQSLTECLKPLLEKNLKNVENVSYSFVFKARLNDTLAQSVVFDSVTELVRCINPLARVDIGNPDVVILMHVLLHTCLLGVCTKWAALRKYNLQLIAQPEAPKLEEVVECVKSEETVADT